MASANSGPNDIYRYNRANMKKRSKNPDSYAVIAFDGISPFHLSVPCIIFRPDANNSQVPDFKTVVCAADPSPIPTNAGYSIHATHSLDALKNAGTVIVPGWRDTAELPPKALLDALRKAHQHGAKIVSCRNRWFCLARIIPPQLRAGIRHQPFRLSQGISQRVKRGEASRRTHSRTLKRADNNENFPPMLG